MKKYYCENCEKWRGDRQECQKCGEETVAKKLPKARGDYYYIPGVDKPLRRVTDVIGEVLAKPGLEHWKREQCVDKALETLEKEEAMKAHHQAKDKAAKSGTDIHKMIENLLDGNEVEGIEDEPKLKAFVKFCKDIDFKPLETELTVYDKELGVAGTADAIVEVDDEKWLIDWKTGKGVYLSAKIQISAYKHMIDQDIDRTFIVHLKENAYDLMEIEDHWDAFQAILTLKDLKDEN